MDPQRSHDDVKLGAPVLAEVRSFAPLCEIEKEYIARVMRAVRGNQYRASRILGLTRWSLARRLRKHGLAPAPRIPCRKSTLVD